MVVVDDQALVVSAFEMLLNAQADLEVAGSAADGAAALALLRRLRLRGRGADVVLMDIRMPVMDGVETIGAMRAEEGLREIPVLVLTTFDEEELVLGALRAGARGFLLKDASPDFNQARDVAVEKFNHAKDAASEKISEAREKYEEKKEAMGADIDFSGCFGSSSLIFHAKTRRCRTFRAASWG